MLYDIAQTSVDQVITKNEIIMKSFTERPR